MISPVTILMSREYSALIRTSDDGPAVVLFGSLKSRYLPSRNPDRAFGKLEAFRKLVQLRI